MMNTAGSFELLSHTADIRLRITAPTLSDLLAQALAGMNEILMPDFQPDGISKRIETAITVTSSDDTSMLIDFLSDALTLTHEHKALFTEIIELEITGSALQATLIGRVIDGFTKDIKAVTYHEADVRRNSAGLLESIVVFDI